MPYEIQQNVPMPEARGNTDKFPLMRMEVGDSFEIIGEMTAQSCRGAKSKLERLYPDAMRGRQYTVRTMRTDPDGDKRKTVFRCWRLT